MAISVFILIFKVAKTALIVLSKRKIRLFFYINKTIPDFFLIFFVINFTEERRKMEVKKISPDSINGSPPRKQSDH